MQTGKGKIVRETVERFPDKPSLTLAKYLVHEYGELFDQKVENARSLVRTYRGTHGEKNRRKYKNLIVPRIERIPPSLSPVRSPFILPPGTWLLMQDLHVPFHSPKAIEAAVNYGIKQKITGVIMFEMQDCAALSFWPTARRDFNKEIEMAIDFNDWLRKAVGNKVQIIEAPGNHGDRLEKYLIDHALELVKTPVCDMEVMLDLENRGIEYLQQKQIIQAGYLYILHGHEVRLSAGNVNPARSLYLKTKAIAVCGHLHRTSEHAEVGLDKKLVTCWSVGCLCGLEPDYAPINNWNWGFGILHLEKSGMFEFENKRILPDGKTVV